MRTTMVMNYHPDGAFDHPDGADEDFRPRKEAETELAMHNKYQTPKGNRGGAATT